MKRLRMKKRQKRQAHYIHKMWRRRIDAHDWCVTKVRYDEEVRPWDVTSADGLDVASEG
jgi:hypothetical protein